MGLKMKVKAVVMVVSLGIIGCASVQNIQSSEPTITMTSRKSAKQMQNCFVQSSVISDFTGMGNSISLIQTEENGIYKVLIHWVNLFFSAPDAEITFKPEEGGGSIIEIRKGSRPSIDKALWNYISSCDAKP
jgi:hypothetical protein